MPKKKKTVDLSSQYIVEKEKRSKSLVMLRECFQCMTNTNCLFEETIISRGCSCTLIDLSRLGY